MVDGETLLWEGLVAPLLVAVKMKTHTHAPTQTHKYTSELRKQWHGGEEIFNVPFRHLVGGMGDKKGENDGWKMSIHTHTHVSMGGICAPVYCMYEYRTKVCVFQRSDGQLTSEEDGWAAQNGLRGTRLRWGSLILGQEYACLYVCACSCVADRYLVLW